MIQLRTLGRLDLLGSPGKASAQVIGQPKRAGLLVYLAQAEPRGFQRRDSLVALFWPEMDTVRARQSLRQAVYVFRRALGKDAILSRGGEELSINPEKLECDARVFEVGIVSGRAETVLDGYAGDFLAGFFVSGASPEFEEWVASERQRLRALAANGAWAVSMQEERARNSAGAAHWARRAVSFTPDDEEATRDLMILLARVGDRSGALRAYDHLASRMLADFDAQPSPELSQLAAEMRTAAARFTPAMPPPPPSPRLTPEASGRIERRRSHEPSGSRRWPWLVLAGVVLGAGVLVGGRVFASPEPAPVFAVGEISDHSRADSAQDAPAFANLLATSIARVPGLEVVGSPRLHEIRGQGLSADSTFSFSQAAKSAGALRLLEGDLRQAGGGLILDLRIVDVGSGKILHVLRSRGDDPFELADRAASSLAAELKLPGPSQPLSDITTNSIVALRLYEQGLSAYYTSDFRAAGRLFSAALSEDSSFSMSAFFRAKVAYLLDEPSSDSLSWRAIGLAARASDRDRLLIKGTIEQYRMLPSARAHAETLAVRYPSDVDGQLVLGQTRWMSADYRGAVEALQNVIGIDSLSLNREGALCRACEAYGGLIEAYRYWDSLPAALRTAREWVARSPHSGPAWRHLAGALEGFGRSAEFFRAIRTSDSLMRRVSQTGLSQAMLDIRDGRYAAAEAELERLISTNDGRATEYRWYLVIALWQQGKAAEAHALTDSSAIDLSLVLRAQTLLLADRHREAAHIFVDIADDLAPLRDGHSAKHQTWHLTHAATAFAGYGDTARLVPLADTIELAGAGSLFGRDARLHHYVRGLLARARNDPPTAEREFRLAVTSWNMGYTRINYELAEVLLETNRPAEAVRVLQPAFRGSIESSNMYITRTELHELLARAWDQAGNRDSARAHWRAVVEAWRGADPEFQPRWQTAVAALARR